MANTATTRIIEGVVIGLIVLLLAYLASTYWPEAQSSLSKALWHCTRVFTWLVCLLVALALWGTYITWFLLARAGYRPSELRPGRDARLRVLLTGRKYVLTFNVQEGRKKAVVFCEDGSIATAQGQNNEHTWRVKAGRLEILGADGRVFSRFRFVREHKRFECTDDMDLRCIKGQILSPCPESVKPGGRPSGPA